MNRRETSKAVAVMQAFADGKEVEVAERRHDKKAPNWRHTTTPIWDWADYDYRIKPEPRRIWATIASDGTLVTATSHKPVAALAHNYSEFIEVIKEPS